MLHGLGDCTPRLHCGCLSPTDPREAVIDRILSGQPGPVDTDEREPDPPARWDEQRGVERMEDDYERALDRRWE